MPEVLARFIAVRRPGAFLVDNFPVLAKNPIFNLLSNWKSIGRQYHDLDNAIFMEFWNRMKKSVDDGTAPHSFAKTLLNSYEKNGLTENEAAWIWYVVFAILNFPPVGQKRNKPWTHLPSSIVAACWKRARKQQAPL